jgi:hypothetical protein
MFRFAQHDSLSQDFRNLTPIWTSAFFFNGEGNERLTLSAICTIPRGNIFKSDSVFT